jgi:putative transposase
VTGQHRSTQRRPPQGQTDTDPDFGIREWLRQWAKTHPRQGFRRAYHDARGEGWIVNHKRFQRLRREEGLRVPQRRRRKRVGASTVTTVTADSPNRVWALDFQFDATEDGRPVKIVSIVDEHTRECLGGLVERSITADRLIDELDRIAAGRGYPAVVRRDNGPELACSAMADWARERVGLAFIPPGQPWRNGLHRIIQRRAARRMPQHQQFLVTRPGPGSDHRLENRLPPAATTFGPGLPHPGRIRCHLHTSMNRSHRFWTNNRGPVRCSASVW